MPGRIRNTLDNTNELVDMLKDLIRKLNDGIEGSIIRDGEGTFLQFFTGEINELPIKVKVKL